MAGIQLGPWATALDQQSGAQLSTFWRKRMARLPSLGRANGPLPRGARGMLALLAAGVLAAPLLFVSPAASQPPPAATPPARADDGAAGATAVRYLPRPTAAEARIHKELDTPTTLEFSEAPLQDAINYLRDLHGIEIQLDIVSMSDTLVEPDTPVTQNLKDLALKSALRLMLKPMGLTYVVTNEVLLITSLEAADKLVVARTYPVADLVKGEDDLSAIVRVLRESAPHIWNDAQGKTITAFAQNPSLVIAQSQDAHEQILQQLNTLRELASVQTPPVTPRLDSSPMRPFMAPRTAER